tara:strand:- start:5280 stop:5549 length:270 start_codon:yes stop_codon:yes gene_type:complete
MRTNLKQIRIWLWGIFAELEYQLYPWKGYDPPQWAIDRYNLHCGDIDDEYQDRLHFEWLKSHDDKIGKLQLEMINVLDEINKLKENHDV